MRTRIRKRAVRAAVMGVLLVVIAVTLHAGGYLSRLEAILYDVRARFCQAGRPPPAPLVHLDVDDDALQDVGHWPWPPATMARILDEVGRAGPKVLAMDVIFVEPVPVSYDKAGRATDQDAELAAAVRRLGRVLLPVSLNFDPVGQPSRVRRLALPVLVADPERTREQVVALLAKDGVTAADFDRDPADSYLQLRQAAMYERVWREIVATAGAGDQLPDPAALRRRVLPHADPMAGDVGADVFQSTIGKVFQQAYDQASRQWVMVRFTRPAGTAGGPPVLTANREMAPIVPLGRAAAHSAFIDVLPEAAEGTVRAVPLLAQYRGRVYPQMGLATACAFLGVDARDVRLTETTLTIPRPGGAEIVVPVSVRESPAVGSVAALMNVPMFGRPGDWATMYDPPDYRRAARYLSVNTVWQACQTTDRLAQNEATGNDRVVQWFARRDEEKAVRYKASPATGDELTRRIREVLDGTPGNDDGLKTYVANLRKSIAESPDLEATFHQDLTDMGQLERSLGAVLDQRLKLEAQLAQQRGALRATLHDQAVFFGGTATSLSDIRPTSLFPECPGVLVHGAVFNAIVTGKMWRRAPDRICVAVTLAAAVMTLLMVLLLPPEWAFVGSAALGIGYVAVNGWVLFARHDLILDAGGPVVGIAVVWVVMTLTNYLTTIREAARIRRRFQAYTDPKVVSYYQEHPEKENIRGESRELTIGFSDLAGFTTLTDQLGERVVPLLGDYVAKMIPVIRACDGTFDKQIGDGLCFFFGAPYPSEAHAGQAVRTALAMHIALTEFNRLLVDRGLSTLGMRIGLATGHVIVGDAGAANAASYTTLGGTTNLAARLESANKNFGTRTLITARTVELLDGAFLCRPIANLRVAGKLSCTVVYEPLCATADATDADRRLADLTTAVFDTYRRGDFAGCRAAVADLEAAFGQSKLTALYAERAAGDDPNAEHHCDGQIVLTEK